MSLFDLFKPKSAEAQEAEAASAHRQADIAMNLRAGRVPSGALERLHGAAKGTLPWMATMTPAELMITRSHGIRPIAAVSATCWLHYGWSWTLGHAQGWETALNRLVAEAVAAGANAVLDVKMRTIPLAVENSMDFSLIGTAVKIDGIPAGAHPIVATVPALEFVKLLEADVVPTGIAIGADYEWMTDWRGNANQQWMGNIESRSLSDLWKKVRRNAHADLKKSASRQGNGVLAHINFSQMFEQEGGEDQPKQYLARHIVVATTIDGRRGTPLPHEFSMVVDMHQGATPLTGTSQHHQSYASNDEDGAI